MALPDPTEPDPAGSSPATTIRDAATLILIRRDGGPARVLMGQRGAGAAFMPSKFVFPGGAVDPGDDHPPPLPLSKDCTRRLGGAARAATLIGAARRELAEETGLRLAAPRLRFVFRAITPPGRSRRYDARFLLAEAEGLAGDPEDFSQASDELSHLRWLPLAEARTLDLPFVTEIALSEVTHLLAGGDQPGVPFFDNSGPTPRFRRLT
ncbi:NUDIX hydrolase [Pseudogemmobacter sonorensis]|uniref:NUDIX hydrolase n=1 Tax=Pseudogemmobacter sonorensis TaxID=2989681 RepID=UPI0036CE31B8